MPEDERAARTPDLTDAPDLTDVPDLTGADGSLRVLSEGTVEVKGRLPWSSNYTFLVTVSLDGKSLRAVYKPGRGERHLWDFPPRLFVREVAAFRLSEVLGLNVVPETVLREDGPFGEGSLQRFVDADFTEHYFTLLEDDAYRVALMTIAGFDLLANNADRKGGHCLLDTDGRVWGIDHGLCFHPEPKLRTVMWDFAGEEVPRSVLDSCAAVAGTVGQGLEDLLTSGELRALVRRAESVADSGRFPQPPLDGRAYPWPLV